MEEEPGVPMPDKYSQIMLARTWKVKDKEIVAKKVKKKKTVKKQSKATGGISDFSNVTNSLNNPAVAKIGMFNKFS